MWHIRLVFINFNYERVMSCILRIQRTLLAKYLICIYLLFHLAPQSLWSGFEQNKDDTLNVTISIDVTGSAHVTPFVQNPDGAIAYQSAQLVTDVSDYKFPTFSIPAPIKGTYSIGVLAKGKTAALVVINTDETLVSNSKADIILQNLGQNAASVAVNRDQFAWLTVPVIYNKL